MADAIAIAVFGAGGRMGRAIIEVIESDPGASLGAAIERDGHGLIGEQAGAGAVYSTASSADLGPCAAMIAFPAADGVDEALACALGAKLPLVVGTTGMDDKAREKMVEASKEIPVLAEPNMSLGVSVLAKLVADAAARLPGWDAEVFEIHHRGKVDAPSGTALRLHDAIASARGGKGRMCTDRSARRQGRPDDEIGHAVMRAGDVVGEHTVLLAGTGERIELTHRALSRATFASGAVFAAKELAGMGPGMHSLDALLG